MITVAEIRSNGRDPEPRLHGNRAETAQLVLDSETEILVGSGAEAIQVLIHVDCRNESVAIRSRGPRDSGGQGLRDPRAETSGSRSPRETGP